MSTSDMSDTEMPLASESWGAGWLYEGDKGVDQSSGELLSPNYYPAGFLGEEEQGDTTAASIAPSGDEPMTSAIETADSDGSDYQSDIPPATSPEISTFTHQDDRTKSEEKESGASEENSNTRVRRGSACHECAKVKQKCDAKTPCGRCLRLGSTCTRPVRAPPAPRPRSLRATCDGCRTAQWKCDKNKPRCARCRDKGLKCVYSPRKKAGQVDSEEELSDNDFVAWT